jgi:hypothetical protein
VKLYLVVGPDTLVAAKGGVKMEPAALDPVTDTKAPVEAGGNGLGTRHFGEPGARIFVHVFEQPL